jgi:CHAD domain-containing protein
MAFQLEQDESVARGVQRVLVREIDKALERLGADDPSPAAVHDARKRFKKVRALLKLSRKGLGTRFYQRENARFRDAGKPLTNVRDGQALVEALDALGKCFADELGSPETLAPVRKALVQRAEALQQRVLGDRETLAAVAADIQLARRRLKGRKFRKGGWVVFRSGLMRTYGRGQEALEAVLAERSVEHLHEWRKRVKDLWHQLQFLQGACPVVLGESADRYHELADLLGDDHDLTVLTQVLAQELTQFAEPAAAGEEPLASRLQCLIERRHEELREQALELGHRLHADAPEVFIERIRDYWKVWRSGRQKQACEKA